VILGAVLWDFDGTLAVRPGHWGGCLLEMLDAREPGHGVSQPVISELLNHGWPWHEHETPHPHLSSPGAWWRHIENLLRTALTAAAPQLPRARADALLSEFRSTYLDSARWSVYPDSAAALKVTAAAGWRNVIVSNHAPELPGLMRDLGLADAVDAVICSAQCGYEKPHPEIFREAMRAAGQPRSAWMVGDNPVADIAGAAWAGIPGILVRTPEVNPEFLARLQAAHGRSDPHLRAATALDAACLITSAGDLPRRAG
jgi:putative hydrolase of the HAD superfamily